MKRSKMMNLTTWEEETFCKGNNSTNTSNVGSDPSKLLCNTCYFVRKKHALRNSPIETIGTPQVGELRRTIFFIRNSQFDSTY